MVIERIKKISRIDYEEIVKKGSKMFKYIIVENK